MAQAGTAPARTAREAPRQQAEHAAGTAAGRAAAVLGTAARLAAEVLAPAAMRVEATQRVPASHLDLLAAEGFYGMSRPA